MKIICKNMFGYVMLDIEIKGEIFRWIMQSGVFVKLVGINFVFFFKRCVWFYLIISNF